MKWEVTKKRNEMHPVLDREVTRRALGMRKTEVIFFPREADDNVTTTSVFIVDLEGFINVPL